MPTSQSYARRIHQVSEFLVGARPRGSKPREPRVKPGRPTSPQISDLRSSISSTSGIKTSSTRRFCFRPSSASFLATGSVSP